MEKRNEEEIKREKGIMDNWFKSRFNVENNYEASRHGINNRIEYDIDLIRQYATEVSSVLDLGCGTGVIEEQLANCVSYIKAIDKYQEFLERAKVSENIEYEKHDVASYVEDKVYNLIIMFGVTIYLLDEEVESVLKNCSQMMDEDSTFIIKNQWSMESEDLVVDKQYSDTNTNSYYAVYRTISKMKELASNYGFNVDVIDIYPAELNKYSNTHEYALICKKKN